MHPLCARTRPALPRPAHPATPYARRSGPCSGRAWLSSYYLVFLACFLDLAESTKKAHGTEGTPQLRRCQKEGSHQKQSDLQGNQGRHEPARMCSFARLACCRRRRPASHSLLRSLRFLFLWRFCFRPSSRRRPRGRRRAAARSRDRAAAAAARHRRTTHHACSLDDVSRVHVLLFLTILYEFIGRESSRCLNSSVLVARSPHGFL